MEAGTQTGPDEEKKNLQPITDMYIAMLYKI